MGEVDPKACTHKFPSTKLSHRALVKTLAPEKPYCETKPKNTGVQSKLFNHTAMTALNSTLLFNLLSLRNEWCIFD